MHNAGSTLQEKSVDDSGSQSSRREFKRFRPKEVDETSLQKKKLNLENHHGNLSLVQPKSKSKQKDMGDSQVSTPVSSLARNNSHTIFRSNKPQERKSEKPPLAPKNVRFTFGKPGELPTSASQFISKAASQQSLDAPSNIGYSTITDQLNRNFGSQWRQPDSNLHSEKGFEVESRIEAVPCSPRGVLEQSRQRQLLLEIQKYRAARKLLKQKIRDLKDLQGQLLAFVKDSLFSYQTNIAELARQLTVRFARDLKTWQVQTEAKLLSKVTVEANRRTGQQNNRTFNTDRLSPQRLPAAKLDHSNIMDKLDKIKYKLDEMTKIKEDCGEESTSATLSSMEQGSRDQIPRKRLASQLTRVTSIQQFKQGAPE